MDVDAYLAGAKVSSQNEACLVCHVNEWQTLFACGPFHDLLTIRVCRQCQCRFSWREQTGFDHEPVSV